MTLHEAPRPERRDAVAPLRELPLFTVLAVAAAVLLFGLAGKSSSAGVGPGPIASGAEGVREGATVTRLADRGADLASDDGGSTLAEPDTLAHRSEREALASGRRTTGAPRDRSGASADGVPGSPTSDDESSGLARASGAVSTPDGLRERGDYRAGVREGVWETLWPDGSLRTKGSYEEGLREGRWDTWSSYGVMIECAHYEGGVLHGDWQLFADDGSLIGDGQYDENLRSGRWTLYYTDGQLKESGLYVDGLREGPWEFYDDLGRLTARTGEYRAGIKID